MRHQLATNVSSMCEVDVIEYMHGLRCDANSSVGARPAWECPINLITTPNPDGVRSPRFCVSAICHICIVLYQTFDQLHFLHSRHSQKTGRGLLPEGTT